MTGLPGTSPTVPTGQPSPFHPLATVPQTESSGFADIFYIVVNDSIKVSNDVAPNSIQFVGLSPGSVGLYQINFVLPRNLNPADVQIKLERFVCAPIGGDCSAPSNDHVYDSVPVLLPIG